ncbi:hypothetical protein L226DRAFT_538771 [Lentinus tigrinus ALCF2SS1-7]|uniref:uncharacterized protein n=1 Tax=Lentinus tigrinus ALCF2SS1-7 TaxID=1328758 RepID=UPI001165DBD4|nr:hypothetical protein L226DRAFT_538771 [Lentinus tigrinus ALCF2SS1-7]
MQRRKAKGTSRNARETQERITSTGTTTHNSLDVAIGRRSTTRERRPCRIVLPEDVRRVPSQAVGQDAWRVARRQPRMCVQCAMTVIVAVGETAY